MLKLPTPVFRFRFREDLRTLLALTSHPWSRSGGQGVEFECGWVWRGRRSYYSRQERQREERKREEQRKVDFRTLGLPEDCKDEGQVREAYLQLAKKHHPDSASQPDQQVFHKIDTAYRNLLKDFAAFRHNRHKVEGEYGLYYKEEEREEPTVEEDSTPDIRHTAPQHRHYLSYSGIGTGTPSQREKQYDKWRRVKAAENVVEYRVQQQVKKGQGQEEEEMALALRAKKTKTGIGMERLVEDLIQESMARGDFDNLSGKGKPLPQSEGMNPFVDFTTHKLNQVLIQNGFAPEWILLEKEIREEVRNIRAEISGLRHTLGERPGQGEVSMLEERVGEVFREDVAVLNKKVDKFNLTVPSLHKQIVPVDLGREVRRALKTFSPEIRERVERGEVLWRKMSGSGHSHAQAELRRQEGKVESGRSEEGFVGALFSILKKS